jgi:GTPase involved in cell partitioning and DNA repair
MQAELGAYAEGLLQLPAVIVANKIDLLETPQARVAELKEATNIPVIAVSGLSGKGLSDLKLLLNGLLVTRNIQKGA